MSNLPTETISRRRCRRCRKLTEEPCVVCKWCGASFDRPRLAGEVIVPTPRLLPSGNWNIQMRLSGQSYSITKSSREECILEATRIRLQYEKDKAEGTLRKKAKDLTLGEYLERFIHDKEPVLSPTTIRSYKAMARSRYPQYIDKPFSTISVQEMINDDFEDHSPKSVKNAWALCTAALRYSKVDFETPTLPRIARGERLWLDYKQIQIFLTAIRGQPCELPALLALHSLRASEAFGLRPVDYDKCRMTLHVQGARHRTGWVKLNKSDSSNRVVPIIIPRLKTLLDELPEHVDYILPEYDSHVYEKINRTCEANELPTVGMHGLRHSFASLAYHLSWKKKTTMEVGGWSNSKVLDAIYTHNADLQSDLETMREFYSVSNTVSNSEQ